MQGYDLLLKEVAIICTSWDCRSVMMICVMSVILFVVFVLILKASLVALDKACT